jgi:hypothetical protein
MVVNRRGLALSAAVAIVLSAVLVAQKKDDKKQGDGQKQSDAQKKEILDIVKLVDDASAGQPASNDFGLTWAHEDYLKATQNKQYIPFTVTFDASKLTSPNVAFYWRVVAKESGATATLTLPGAKKDDKSKAARYAYEDINFIPGNAGKGRLSRSFTVQAGTYDVYVVMKEPVSPTTQKNAPAAAKASLIKQTLTVPDFWAADLTTSSIIVSTHIEPLTAPLSPNEQLERPYAALGSMEIVPSLDNKFTTKDELSIFFLIYGTKYDPMNKPDVSVEYSFYAKPAGVPEKFFNKTAPQALNATTLPKEFDMSVGHQLSTGQGVPLASFPVGDYRLEIKIIDKLGTKTVTRDVNFTVTAG